MESLVSGMCYDEACVAYSKANTRDSGRERGTLKGEAENTY